MNRWILLLAVTLLSLVPADALARAGGGSHSFRGPSGGGGSGGRGLGGGGHHFIFFGGGGGGFLLLIVLVLVAGFLLSRSGRARRT